MISGEFEFRFFAHFVSGISGVITIEFDEGIFSPQTLRVSLSVQESYGES